MRKGSDFPSIGVFYPASAFDLELLDKGIDKYESIFSTKVFRPELPKERKDYAIGSLKERTESLEQCLNHPNLHYLWAARGGYGCIELLPYLSKKVELFEHKMWIGYSDVTAIHAFVCNLGLTSLHAPMPATQNWLDTEGVVLNSFVQSLNHRFFPVPVEFSDNIQGRLIGGNLSVLASLMGTPWQLKIQPGDILFLEDVHEAHYALARSLKQLSYSENFSKCSIIWGHLTKCQHEKENYQSLIKTLMEPYGLSYGFSVPCGHENPNFTLRLGSTVEIKSQEIIFKK